MSSSIDSNSKNNTNLLKTAKNYKILEYSDSKNKNTIENYSDNQKIATENSDEEISEKTELKEQSKNNDNEIITNKKIAEIDESLDKIENICNKDNNTEKKRHKKRKLYKKRKIVNNNNDNLLNNSNKENDSLENNLNSIEEKNDSSSNSSEQKEIEEYLKKKRNRHLKMKKEIKKSPHNGDDEIQLLLNYTNRLKKENDSSNKKFSKNKEKSKKLIKNTENKEMKLSLDAECVICCNIIEELANPDGCNHDFCKDCLFDWTQKSNKCPICKAIYNNVFIYDKGIKKQLTINQVRDELENLEENSKQNEEEESEDNSEDICYVCGKSTEPENLLICDKCERNFCHYYCAKLKKIPQGNWYCTYCLEKIKESRKTKKMIGNYIM